MLSTPQRHSSLVGPAPLKWPSAEWNGPASVSQPAAAGSGGLDFALVLVLNAVLFIRPAEIIPALANMPIYNWVILTCLAVSLATILNQLGLSQDRLWFLHNGRNEKLTDFGGTVIKEMLA